MRLAVQSIALLLVLYVLLVAGLVWWARSELVQASDTIMAETAEVVGTEVAAALTADVVRDLLEGDPASRRTLLDELTRLARASDLVIGAAVVDSEGEVFASDRFLAIGRFIPRPEAIFGDERRISLTRLPLEPESEARYRLEIPLVVDDDLVGAFILGLSSAPLEDLYADSRRRLTAFAAASLVAVGALGFLLHLQLSRRSHEIAVTLEKALAGDLSPGDEPRRRDEFGEAVAAARRVGRALSTERRRSERTIDAMSRLTDVGIVFVDARGEIEHASDTARELTRASSRSLEEIVAELREDPGKGALEVDGRRLLARMEGGGSDGGRVIELRDAEIVEGVETDLRLAAYLRGLTRLYLGVAHDLKAPLNAMVLHLELLRRSLEGEAGAEDEKRRRWLEVVERELQRLRRSLELLLDQTAPSGREAETFDLREVAEEIGRLLAPQGRQQGVEVHTEAGAERIPVHGVRDQIKQALLNVAINALEATGEGGTVAVVAERSPEPGEARVVVRDTGPGIPDDLVPRIFDLRVSTKSSGTGIGLPVARSVLESNRGALRLASTGPEGTVFEASLPISRKDT